MHDNEQESLNDGLIHYLSRYNFYPDLRMNQLNDDRVELSDEQLL